MVHKSVLAKALKAAMSGALVGFCLACGRKATGVEPDGIALARPD